MRVAHRKRRTPPGVRELKQGYDGEEGRVS